MEISPMAARIACLLMTLLMLSGICICSDAAIYTWTSLPDGPLPDMKAVQVSNVLLFALDRKQNLEQTAGTFW